MLELSPADDYAHYALGRCLEKQGSDARGERALQAREPDAAREHRLLLADPRPGLEPGGAEDDDAAERGPVDLPRVAAAVSRACRRRPSTSSGRAVRDHEVKLDRRRAIAAEGDPRAAPEPAAADQDGPGDRRARRELHPAAAPVRSGTTAGPCARPG